MPNTIPMNTVNHIDITGAIISIINLYAAFWYFFLYNYAKIFSKISHFLLQERKKAIQVWKDIRIFIFVWTIPLRIQEQIMQNLCIMGLNQCLLPLWSNRIMISRFLLSPSPVCHHLVKEILIIPERLTIHRQRLAGIPLRFVACVRHKESSPGVC